MILRKVEPRPATGVGLGMWSRPWWMLLVVFLMPARAAAQPVAPEALLHELDRRWQVLDVDIAIRQSMDFVRTHPKHERAPALCERSVEVLVVLSRLDQATTALHTYLKLYGRSRSEDGNRLRWLVARAHVGHEDAIRAEKLVRSLGRLDRPERIARLGILALAAHQRGDEPEASKLFGRLVSQQRALAGVSPDDPLGAFAIEVVSEAFYRRAQALAAKVEAAPRRFRGVATDEALARWAKDVLKPWVTARHEHQKRVEAAYRDVLHVQPAAHPRWATRSAADVAQFLWQLVADVGEAYPRTRMKDGSMRPADGFDEVLAPYLRQARAASRICVSYAVRSRWFEATERCRAPTAHDETHTGELAPTRLRIATPVPPSPLRRR